MTLEHHVTSLDLSRKLKELGVPQETIFAWEKNHQGRWSIILGTELFSDLERNPELPQDLFCSAFIASELGEMLPKGVQFGRDDDGWYVAHEYGPWKEEDRGVHVEHADTEPDARAKLLIHLIEQKIIDPKTL